MTGFQKLCDAIAEVLLYPKSDYVEKVVCFRDIALSEAPSSVEAIESFMASVDGKPLNELEEAYIRTFDLNPLCSLDTGWQLFGEEYNRGLYMVKIREEMRRLGLPETTELPDHLTNTLRVLGRMTNDEAISFSVSCLIPATRKILGAIKQEDPYRPLVEGVSKLLDLRYGRYVKEFEEAAAAAEAAIMAKGGEAPDYSEVFAMKEAGHE